MRKSKNKITFSLYFWSNVKRFHTKFTLVVLPANTCLNQTNAKLCFRFPKKRLADTYAFSFAATKPKAELVLIWSRETQTSRFLGGTAELPFQVKPDTLHIPQAPREESIQFFWAPPWNANSRDIRKDTQTSCSSIATTSSSVGFLLLDRSSLLNNMRN